MTDHQEQRVILSVVAGRDVDVLAPANLAFFPESKPHEISFTFDAGSESIRYLFPPASGGASSWSAGWALIREWQSLGVNVSTHRLDMIKSLVKPRIGGVNPSPAGAVGLLLGTQINAVGRVSMKAYCDGFVSGARSSLRLAGQIVSKFGHEESWFSAEKVFGRYNLPAPLVALDLEESGSARVKVYLDTSARSWDDVIDVIDRFRIGSSRLIRDILGKSGHGDLCSSVELGSAKRRSMLCWSISGSAARPQLGLTAYLPINQILADRAALQQVMLAATDELAFGAFSRLLVTLDEATYPQIPFHWLAIKVHTPGSGAGLYCPKEVVERAESCLRDNPDGCR